VLCKVRDLRPQSSSELSQINTQPHSPMSWTKIASGGWRVKAHVELKEQNHSLSDLLLEQALHVAWLLQYPEL
jgi:hypothetical protein